MFVTQTQIHTTLITLLLLYEYVSKVYMGGLSSNKSVKANLYFAGAGAGENQNQIDLENSIVECPRPRAGAGEV